MTKALLVTPPFTQLNTPYPATMYLKDFLNKNNYSTYQLDLSIETFTRLFSRNGFISLFNYIQHIGKVDISDNCLHIIALADNYCNTVDDVIGFLQGKNSTLANRICNQNFLPQASRFKNVDEDAFGYAGLHDKARHFCTLYIEDMFDLIVECVDNRFGINRYAEQLASSASDYSIIYDELKKETGFIEDIFIDIFISTIIQKQPELVAFTIPFPGNLFSALRCAQALKINDPKIKTIIGGGYINTELHSISDKRFFEHIDFVLYKEVALKYLIEYIDGERKLTDISGCSTIVDGNIVNIA